MNGQLVRIEHIRCDEHSGAHTYVCAPDDWDHDEIYTAVISAKKDYDAARRLVLNPGRAPNDYRQYGRPNYHEYPDKTVREIDQEWEDKRRVWEEWHSKQSTTSLRFENFLEKHGLLGVWKAPALEIEVDWGHNHGTRLNYGHSTDEFPTPRALVTGEEDDDTLF